MEEIFKLHKEEQLIGNILRFPKSEKYRGLYLHHFGEQCRENPSKKNQIVYKMHCCAAHDLHLDSVQEIEDCKYIITMSLYEACFANHNPLKTIEIWILTLFFVVFCYCSIWILNNLFNGQDLSLENIPHYGFWNAAYEKLTTYDNEERIR